MRKKDAISKLAKIVIAVVIIAIIAAGGAYAVIYRPSTSSGHAVPNPTVFIEENPIEPGPGGLDPALTWDPSDVFFLNVYENLLHFNGSNPTQFVPWLAQNYTVAPNGTQYVFNLRQGITFQDGTPFNASAVKFSYDRAILINHVDGPEFLIGPNITMGIRGAPEYEAANTTHNTDMPAVQAYLAAGGIKVLGTYTVEFNLEHPYAATLATFAWESLSIVSPSYVEANCPGTTLTPGVMPGFECTFMETHMMGTGPFMLKSYIPKSEIDFVRYNNYWGTPYHTGPAKLQEYIVKDVQEVGTRELDLLSGAADAISLPASNAFDLVNQQIYQANGSIVPIKSGIRIWEASTNAISTMVMDPRFTPFNDTRFRQAMAYAFPYQQFIQNVSNGFAVKLNGYLTPHMFGYDPTITGYNYNPTMAKQLFDEVGYKGTITLTLQSADATSIEGAVLFKSSIANIDPSININIQEVDSATYLTLYHEYKLPLIFGCCWVPDIADGSETLANFATPDGFDGLTTELNSTTITNDLAVAGASLNQTLRAQLYSQIQQIMLSYAGTIPLYSPDAIQVERTWVLPSNSSIGRGLYNPQYGDGSGGVEGGYLAYYIDKATTTPYPIALAIDPTLSPSLQFFSAFPLFYSSSMSTIWSDSFSPRIT